MKKLLSLVLSLMMLLTFASAEMDVDTAEAVEWYTVDFGDFTMDLTADDLLQKGEKTSNAVLAIIYPGYDPEATFYNNINIVWMEEDASASINLLGAETFGQLVLSSAESALQQQKITTANATLLAAEAEGGELVVIYSMDADYSALGVELATTLYYCQYYVSDAELGSYCFTITTTTFEELEALTAYFDTLVFKNDAAAE